MSAYDQLLLAQDINDIHQACENIGFPTDWEYFEDELKTYTELDKAELWEELQDVLEYTE